MVEADEVLATTRAVRYLGQAVPRSVLRECVSLALQAPSPSNTQGPELVVVEDSAQRDALARLYRRDFAAYERMPLRDYPEGDARDRKSVV